LHDARISQRDDRGLMPRARARRVVEGATAFRKGEGKLFDGTFVLDSDRLWAALLSLENAEEFVRHATRLSWEFHVRGRNNVAPFERYGDAMLPWLQSRLEANGVLHNIPWCVLPCLLEIGSTEALELALQIRAVHELLPGQPALGQGPGAFAHGGEGAASSPPPEISPEEARTWLANQKGDLTVARDWMSRHPTAYGALARLAETGNARAEALLSDRGQALGELVREALESALGKTEADRLASRFELPASSVPDEVRALLASSPIDDEPRGPLWSIAELDEAARGFSLPLWDNANYTTGAMRITGFASRKGDVLVVESIVTDPGGDELVAWRANAYGPGAGGHEASEVLVDADEDQLRPVELDSNDSVDGVANHLVLRGERDEAGNVVEGSHGRHIVPLPLPHEHVLVCARRALLGMRGEEVRVPSKLPRSFATLPPEERAELRAVSPGEALLVQLCSRHAELLFPYEHSLPAALEFASEARQLFQFTEGEWPAAGEPASSSRDLVTMVEALRTRRRITRLPGTPNSRPECWLPQCAKLRSFQGPDAWPQGEEPIEPVFPDQGVGVTPYWSWLIAERGYPHGAMLMHGPEWNEPEMAQQTIPYLVGLSEPTMQVYWPRRAATVFARVCGGAKESWTAADPGITKAMKDARTLHPPEAMAILRRFAQRTFSPPAHVGAELIDVLEALVGPWETAESLVSALESLSPEAWTRAHPALAAAVFEVGFVLRRMPAGAQEIRERLGRLWERGGETETIRALDLVLHGRAGAERSARSELDYAHVTDDTSWARERILDPATAPSRASGWLAHLAGEGYLDKLGTRLDGTADAAWLVVQLEKLGGPKAVRLLLELWTKRQETRDAVRQAFVTTRPGAAEELKREARGPLGEAAREMLAALEREEQRRFDEKYADDPEEDEGSEEEDPDDEE